MYYLYGDIITEGKMFQGKFIEIENGVISYVGKKKRKSHYSVDIVNNGYICPGFVDVHIHGVDGLDVMDDQPRVFEQLAQKLPKYGVTSFLATTRTAPIDQLVQRLKAGTSYAEGTVSKGAARMLGFHVEGPWISHIYKGAQPEKYIRRLTELDIEDVIIPFAKIIKKITLAPEEIEDMSILKLLTENGIQISAGHTNATIDEISKAMEYGLRHMTHTFNAMSPLHHRDPGAVAAALYHNSLICEVIADGLHVHPKVIELLYKFKGMKHIALISDCTGYNHLADGNYFFRDKHLVKDGNKVTLKNGQLAGSAITVDQGLKYMVNKCSVPLPEAVYMATTTPLKTLQIEPKIGKIKPGYVADFVVLDKDLNVQETLMEGKTVYRVGE